MVIQESSNSSESEDSYQSEDAFHEDVRMGTVSSRLHEGASSVTGPIKQDVTLAIAILSLVTILCLSTKEGIEASTS